MLDESELRRKIKNNHYIRTLKCMNYEIMKQTSLFLLLTFLLFGCQSASYDARQIGRDALTEAYIQMDSSNKTEAMRLFKEAEHIYYKEVDER